MYHFQGTKKEGVSSVLFFIVLVFWSSMQGQTFAEYSEDPVVVYT